MGFPKALLLYRGRTFLESVLAASRAAGGVSAVKTGWCRVGGADWTDMKDGYISSANPSGEAGNISSDGTEYFDNSS